MDENNGIFGRDCSHVVFTAVFRMKDSSSAENITRHVQVPEIVPFRMYSADKYDAAESSAAENKIIKHTSKYLTELQTAVTNSNDYGNFRYTDLILSLCDDFLIASYIFSWKTDLPVEKQIKPATKFMRKAQTSAEAYLRHDLEEFLEAEVKAGIIKAPPVSIIMQEEDMLAWREYGNAVENPMMRRNEFIETRIENRPIQYYDSFPFSIFAILNAKDRSEDIISENSKDNEEGLLRLAAGMAPSHDMYESYFQGSIIDDKTMIAVQADSGLALAYAYGSGCRSFKEYLRALYDRAAVCACREDLSAEIDISDRLRNPDGREEEIRNKTAKAKNIASFIQERVRRFSKTRNKAHDLYASYMESSGGNDEASELSKLCTRINNALKKIEVYDRKKKDEKDTKLLNYIALFAIISAIKDGADLISQLVERISGKEFWQAVIYAAAFVFVIPIVLAIVKDMDSKNSMLTKAYVKRMAKIAIVIGLAISVVCSLLTDLL